MMRSITDFLSWLVSLVKLTVTAEMASCALAMFSMMILLRIVAGPGHLRELFTDTATQALAPAKTGTMMATITFTLYMLGLLSKAPDDPWMWLVFMGTVGGIDVAKRAIAAKAANAATTTPPNAGASP